MSHKLLICVAVGLMLSVACSPSGKAVVPLTTTSDEARAEYLEGRAALDLGRVRHARWRFTLALRADPEFAMAYLGAYETAENATVAENALARAVALAGRVSIGERDIILSTKASSEGDDLVEISYLKDLRRRYPDDPRVHLLFGDLFRRHENFEHAVESFLKAESLAPDAAGPKLRLAEYYSASGRFDGALEIMAKVAALEPEQSRVQQRMGEILMSAGRFDEAERAYRAALALDSKETDAWVGLGNAALFRGDFAAAGEAFARLRQHAIDEESDELRLLADSWIAAAKLHQGQLDSAVEWLDAAAAEAAARSGPLDAVSLRFQAVEPLLDAVRVDDAQSRLDAAQAELQQVGKASAARTQAQAMEAYYRVRVVLARGELEQARNLTRALRRDPASVAAKGTEDRLNELGGRIALAEGDSRQAAVLLGRADNRDPRIGVLRARALIGQSQTDQARKLLESIVNLNQARLELGQALPQARLLLSEL